MTLPETHSMSYDLIISQCKLTAHHCHRLEGHPFQVRNKQDWGQGFNPFTTSAAVLPRSDAGNDAVKPASSLTN